MDWGMDREIEKRVSDMVMSLLLCVVGVFVIVLWGISVYVD